MPKFSANLGFLWSELDLSDAVRVAKKAGFYAVECHWPYDTDADVLRAALEETNLQMLGINTRRGNVEAGENGLSASPGRADEATNAIDEALEYAVAIKAHNIHVMAGNAEGTKAHDTFLENLTYACANAAQHGITILIEPLNSHDAPDYFLRNQAQALEIIDEVSAENLKLMFDCYHVGQTEGDVSAWLRRAWPHIGHIQFASVPDRGTPDHGAIDYPALFKEIDVLGWQGTLGAEYKPNGNTEETLNWLQAYI